MGKNKKSRAKVKFTVELTAEQVFAVKSAIEMFVDRDDSYYARLAKVADSAYAKLPDPGMKWEDFAPAN